MKKYLLFAAAIVLGMVAAAYSYYSPLSRGEAAVSTVIAAVTPAPERVEVTREVMVKSIEGKLEVTTASLTLETYTVAGRCDGNNWQQWAYENCVTLLVPAKVNAGFDWSEFGADDISTDADTVTIKLGQPTIFDVVINHQKIEVLDQVDGWFVTQDKSLQMRALAQASKEIRAKACLNDIYKWASLEGKERIGNNIRTTLQAAGDKRKVEVLTTPVRC
jgi:hypothetical protein